MRSWEETAPFLIGMVVASIIINAVRFKSLKSRLDELEAKMVRLEAATPLAYADIANEEETAK